MNKTLTGVDRNEVSKQNAAILTMMDWTQAFERQLHKLGKESFIANGIRRPLIPLPINFFTKKKNSCEMEQNF